MLRRSLIPNITDSRCRYVHQKFIHTENLDFKTYWCFNERFSLTPPPPHVTGLLKSNLLLREWSAHEVNASLTWIRCLCFETLVWTNADIWACSLLAATPLRLYTYDVLKINTANNRSYLIDFWFRAHVRTPQVLYLPNMPPLRYGRLWHTGRCSLLVGPRNYFLHRIQAFKKHPPRVSSEKNSRAVPQGLVSNGFCRHFSFQWTRESNVHRWLFENSANCQMWNALGHKVCYNVATLFYVWKWTKKKAMYDPMSLVLCTIRMQLELTFPREGLRWGCEKKKQQEWDLRVGAFFRSSNIWQKLVWSRQSILIFRTHLGCFCFTIKCNELYQSLWTPQLRWFLVWRASNRQIPIIRQWEFWSFCSRGLLFGNDIPFQLRKNLYFTRTIIWYIRICTESPLYYYTVTTRENTHKNFWCA